MVHLVYCDNVTKELSKILSGEKTMVIRERPEGRFLTAECLQARRFISWKKEQRKSRQKALSRMFSTL